MPTGYTATLMEKGQTFQEFIMGCARAFGALIEMRDSPNDAPIPDKFEPSDYHAKRLIESREKRNPSDRLRKPQTFSASSSGLKRTAHRTSDWKT